MDSISSISALMLSISFMHAPISLVSDIFSGVISSSSLLSISFDTAGTFSPPGMVRNLLLKSLVDMTLLLVNSSRSRP